MYRFEYLSCGVNGIWLASQCIPTLIVAIEYKATDIICRGSIQALTPGSCTSSSQHFTTPMPSACVSITCAPKPIQSHQHSLRDVYASCIDSTWYVVGLIRNTPSNHVRLGLDGVRRASEEPAPEDRSRLRITRGEGGRVVFSYARLLSHHQGTHVGDPSACTWRALLDDIQVFDDLMEELLNFLVLQFWDVQRQQV